MSPHDLLRRAVLFLPDEASWSRNAIARDASGAPVSIQNPNGVAFDLTGAIERAAAPAVVGTVPFLRLGDRDLIAAAKGILCAHLKCIHLNAWNDAPGRTFAEVKGALLAASA